MTLQQTPGTSDPSDATIISDFIEFRLAELHTAMPGQVTAYDAATNTCDVQPLLRRVFVAADGTETEESAPPLLGVPIWYPRGGGFRITWPLNAGDVVLLAFVERSIDAWSQNGGEVTPTPTRKHDWSDAVALPGLAPTSKAIPGIGTDLALGSEDGAHEVRITSSGDVTVRGQTVALGDSGGAAVARVDDLVEISSSLPQNTAFYAWIAAASAAGPGVAAPYQGSIFGKIITGSSKVTST